MDAIEKLNLASATGTAVVLTPEEARSLHVRLEIYRALLVDALANIKDSAETADARRALMVRLRAVLGT